MEIRPYENKDFKSLVTLLKKHHERDHLTAELVNEKVYEDPQYDPDLIFVGEENKKLIGFMQGVRREIRGEKLGYIKLMVVDKSYRRKGIARDLFLKLEKIFKENGVQKVRIYDVPFNYLMPGIDPRYTPALCFAQRMGFSRFADTSNLIVDVQNQDWSTAGQEEKLKPFNIEVRRVGDEDKSNLLKFIDAEFPLWHAEVENSFKSNPVAVHIALLNGEIKAFSGHNGNNYGTGWFGPMGTHPDLRGKGIGGILLKRCLQDIKDWGLKSAIIPWVGPIDFYSHYANAVLDRVFWRYEKVL
jgi:mycothiol synthase